MADGAVAVSTAVLATLQCAGRIRDPIGTSNPVATIVDRNDRNSPSVRSNHNAPRLGVVRASKVDRRVRDRTLDPVRGIVRAAMHMGAIAEILIVAANVRRCVRQKTLAKGARDVMTVWPVIRSGTTMVGFRIARGPNPFMAVMATDPVMVDHIIVVRPTVIGTAGTTVTTRCTMHRMPTGITSTITTSSTIGITTTTIGTSTV